MFLDQEAMEGLIWFESCSEKRCVGCQSGPRKPGVPVLPEDRCEIERSTYRYGAPWAGCRGGGDTPNARTCTCNVYDTRRCLYVRMATQKAALPREEA